MNDFSKLDAQTPEGHFAQMTPEEQAEADAYYDSLLTEEDQNAKVLKYMIAEGPLYEVRGGEGGSLAVFDCYAVAQTKHGLFVSNLLVVKGDGGCNEDGFRIPNTNYKAECSKLLASLEHVTHINLAQWTKLPQLPTLEQSLEAEAQIEMAERYGLGNVGYPYWLYTLKEDVSIVPHSHDEDLVKDNVEVQAAFRQAMKDCYGQPFLFDHQLEMTVKEAREEIHAMRHAND